MKTKYPLEDVLVVKRRRVEEAERLVKQRKEELEKEEERLKEREKARDEVKEHLKDKIRQLRVELDGGTTTTKIQQMKRYMDVVKEKLAQEEQKVAEQKKQVDKAALLLDEAKLELAAKQKEVDKLKEHKEAWVKEMKKLEEIEEGKEQDELGTIIHSLHNRNKKGV